MKNGLRLALLACGFFLSITISAQSYCVPGGIGFQWCNQGVSDIDDVTIGAFSDLNSGCNFPNNLGYVDLTSQTIYAQMGAPTSYTLGSTGSPHWAMWIDYNGDGDFTDAGEQVLQSASASSTATGSFIVPTSVGISTTRIRIRAQSGSGNLTDPCAIPFNNEVQDYTIVFTSAGSCSSPTNPTSASITSNSAVLNWDSVGTQYNIEWGALGFVPGSGTTLNPIVNTTSLSGLTPNTYYSFYVQNDCSAGSSADSSSWVGPHTFLTGCVEVATYPYTENFDDSPWAPNPLYYYNQDTIDACWNRFPVQPAYAYQWLVNLGPTATNNTGPSTDKSGTGNYLLAEANTGNGAGYMTSPIFNMTALTSPWMSFYYHMYGSQMGILTIEASTDGITWTPVDSIVGQQQSSSTDAWKIHFVDLAFFKSTSTQFRFKGTKGAGSYSDIAVDNIKIEEAPTCQPVTAVAFTNVTGTSLTTSFNGSSNVYKFEYGLTGFTQGTGTVVTTTSSSNAITGLTGTSCYDFYYQQDCSASGDGYSIWVGPYTVCTYITPDWEEDFGVDFLPSEEWYEVKGAIANPTVFTSTYSSWTEDGWLNNGFYFSAKISMNTYSTHQEWFVTPFIDLETGNNYEVYFDAALTATSLQGASVLQADDTLRVVVSTDGVTFNDSNTVLKVHQGSNIDNYGREFSASLANYNGVVKLGVYFGSTVANTVSADLFLDNLGIRSVGTCGKPTNLIATNVAATSLNVGWDNTGATTYSVEYGLHGFTVGSGTTISGLTTNSLLVSNLTSTTEYDFYVTSVCGTTFNGAGPMTVLTGCPNIFATPYSTDFEVIAGITPPTGTFENCWSAYPAISNAFHWRGQAAPNTAYQNGPQFDNTTGIAGGKFVRVEASYTGSDAELVGGPFDISNLTQPTLQFYYYMYGTNMGDLHVDISTDMVNWDNSLVSFSGELQTGKTDPWELSEVILSKYVNDTIYVRFRGVYGTGSRGDMAIDDVSIGEASGCLAPQSLSALNVTTNSADLNWATYEANSTIEWGPCGFTQGSGTGTTVYGVAGTTLSLTGLSQASCYEYYVKDTCLNNSWSGPFSFNTSCVGPMNGLFTVGGTPGATNFNDLNEAINTLENCGVSGPVTIDIVGSDTGSFRVSVIPGISAANTVTFSGDTLFNYGNVVLELDGAEYLIFDGLTFISNSAASIMAVWIHNGTHHITFDNCAILGPVTNALSNSAAIGVSFLPTTSTSEGDNGHDITIKNSRIIGGARGVSFYGSTAVPGVNLTVENSVFDAQVTYAIYTRRADTINVIGNTMSGFLSTYSGYGVYATNTKNVNIVKNAILANPIGIYVSYMNENGSGHTTIANNMVKGSLNLGYNSFDADVFHNTFNAGDFTSFSSYGVQIASNSTDMDLRNNIFIGGSGRAVDNFSADSTIHLDYNIYEVVTSTDFVRFDGVNRTDLAAWQLADANMNQSSIQGIPKFVGVDDLHVYDALANDVGDNSVGIVEDIDGDTRPAVGSTTVDIGADEYTPALNDAGVLAFLEPNNGCGDSSMTVKLVIQNFGSNALTSLPLDVNVTGATPSALSFTYTGGIQLGDIDTVDVGSINTFAGGNVDLMAYATLLNDEDHSNDSLTSETYVFTAGVPQFVQPDTVCSNETTGTLAAVPSNGILHGWYANATDTVPVATGDSLTFPLGATNDYYLGYISQGDDSLAYPGFPAGLNTRSGGVMMDIKSTSNSNIYGFNVESSIISGLPLNVDVYVGLAPSFVGNETTPSKWVLLESLSLTSAGPGSKTDVILSNPIPFSLGKEVAVYLDYSANTTVATLPVNNGKMEILRGVTLWSSFASVNTSNNSSAEVLIEDVICGDTKVLVSLPVNNDTAVAVIANATTVGMYTINVDAAGSKGHLFDWNFGDGNVGAGMTTSHTYTNGGQYEVQLIVTDTTCGSTDTSSYTFSNISIEESILNTSLNVYPNPNNGEFRIDFDVEGLRNVEISISDIAGKIIYTNDLGKVSGTQREKVNLSDYAQGMYIVQLKSDDVVVSQKVSVQ